MGKKSIKNLRGRKVGTSWERWTNADIIYSNCTMNYPNRSLLWLRHLDRKRYCWKGVAGWFFFFFSSRHNGLFFVWSQAFWFFEPCTVSMFWRSFVGFASCWCVFQGRPNNSLCFHSFNTSIPVKSLMPSLSYNIFHSAITAYFVIAFSDDSLRKKTKKSKKKITLASNGESERKKWSIGELQQRI